ncbi:MAG TPA: diguanylate cyclase [Geobacteraceae bacterium]|nr:diguanylate cyclase [Geobacteraceae bacterium]
MDRQETESLEDRIKERTEELERANERLFLANQVKGEFLAHISKELRTPLNHILDLAGLMLEGGMGTLTEEQKSGINAIFESSGRLRSLVDRILDLCSSDIGMTRFMPERFMAADALDKVLERLADTARKRGITVSTRLDEGLGEITADEHKFSFIIEELLTNALKFSARGSRILVSARQVKNVSDRDSGREFIEFAVSDQGTGIRKEDLERIFAGFEVADSVLPENGSLGLGLALVRRFVELHDGRIWVDSSPGEGSNFTFILPKERPLPGESTTPRIMIASGDAGFLQLLSHCLKEEGYEVATAATGLEVLTRGTAQPPDLFVVDLPLSEIDGYNVCLRLKSHAAARHAPILLVVPSLTRMAQIKSSQAGADGILVKPPDLREVLPRIRTMITQKLNYEFLKKKYDIAFSQSRTDPLTGLFNLRQFWEDLDRELERSRRYNRCCSLAMLDIDCFKQFNDRYGHLQGDEVLKRAADIFREHVRNSDIVARYGGEEFVVIMPETERYLAIPAGEKLRKAFGEYHFPSQENRPTVRLTISIGIATFPQDAATSRGLVDMADKALYRAKEGGRDRVTVWDDAE